MFWRINHFEGFGDRRVVRASAGMSAGEVADAWVDIVAEKRARANDGEYVGDVVTYRDGSSTLFDTGVDGRRWAYISAYFAEAGEEDYPEESSEEWVIVPATREDVMEELRWRDYIPHLDFIPLERIRICDECLIWLANGELPEDGSGMDGLPTLIEERWEEWEISPVCGGEVECDGGMGKYCDACGRFPGMLRCTHPADAIHRRTHFGTGRALL